ncbi:MAG TPA: type VI secretion system-associated FHA domain protein [Polyangiaceae bacterium]|nr:type VI secretion system-associated FHA domain protein [Polyangiaceae bacterium]
MATVFVLSAFSLNGEPIADSKRLTALPIRIGRNGLNDYVIGHGGVSSFHARIDDVDGRLCVTDLASKNGVLMVSGGSSGRIRPQQPVDLQPSEFQFFLGVNVRVQVAFDELREPLEQRGALSYTGHVLGNAGVLLGTPANMMPSAPPPPLMAGSPQLAPAAPTGIAAPFQAVPVQTGRPPSVPPGTGGPGGRAATAFLQGLSSEEMALQGLRELAASLVPGQPIDSTGDIARFITKLHDALDAFCRSFIPLREGHSQFMSSLDLQRSRRRSLQRSQAYLAVESARTPEALAAALLNPKDRTFDAPQAVEGILADLMLHQLALLEGVMRGVRALLEELSPENIERQNGGGISLSRHKALWNKYVEIFENVSEERQAFALIFGPEFTAAYRQYRQTSGESQQ